VETEAVSDDTTITTDGLTSKQRLFVAHFLDCLNATEAARRAGYAKPHPEGSRLLQNATVAAVVKAGLAEKAMPEDEVLARLSAIGRADIRELLAFSAEDAEGVPAGSVIGLRLHRDAPLHLIKSMTPTKYGTKIELHDQQAALTTLARVHGLLNTIDWSKIPQPIIEALAEGRLTVDDIKRLAATSAE
jgi:hypothetical protein